MEYVIFLMLSVVALMICLKIFNKGSFVYAVAGKITGRNENDYPPEKCDEKTDFNSESFELDNKRVSTRKLYRTVVWGTCMKPRGINEGDYVFFSKIKKNDLNSLKEGDLILLTKEKELNGKKREVLKIREFRKLQENGRIITTYYDDDGKILYSNADKTVDKRGHSVDNIIGKFYAFYPKEENKKVS